MTKEFNRQSTIGDIYKPAMEITDQFEADAYFEKLVAHMMTSFSKTREEAEDIERQNLGYFAGYYSNDIRERVERLFRCKNPIFGAIADKGSPTPEQALKAGLDRGNRVDKD